MAAQLLGDIFLNGVPSAPSGSVRFYQPGTLAPATVYSNDAATNALTQPISLDSNGRSVSPVYVKSPVRMIVYSSSGAQVVDVERADGIRAENVILANSGWPGETTADSMATALTTSLGGIDGKFLSTGVGASARTIRSKLSEQLSVKDFGAIGNGVADDTQAIVSVVAAATALGGGLIYFPPGTYLTSQAISLPSASSNITFQGAGRTASVIKNTSGSGNAITVTNSAINLSFIDLNIANSSTSTGAGLGMTGNGLVSLTRCLISGHRTGVSATDQIDNIILTDTNITCDSSASAVCVLATSASNNIRLSAYGGSWSVGGSSLVGSIVVSLSGPAGVASIIGTGLTGRTGFSTNSVDVLCIGGNVAPAIDAYFTLYTVTGGTPNLTFIGQGHAASVPTNSAKVVMISPLNAGAHADSGAVNSQSFAVSSAYAPNVFLYRHHRITASVGGTTITINGPSAGAIYIGALHTITCINTSGGAVTWTFDANYRCATVAPASGTNVSVTFMNNGTTFSEIYRSGAVPN